MYFCFEPNAQFLKAPFSNFWQMPLCIMWACIKRQNTLTVAENYFMPPSNQCHSTPPPSYSLWICFLYRMVPLVLQLYLNSIKRHVLFVFGCSHLRCFWYLGSCARSEFIPLVAQQHFLSGYMTLFTRSAVGGHQGCVCLLLWGKLLCTFVGTSLCGYTLSLFFGE